MFAKTYTLLINKNAETSSFVCLQETLAKVKTLVKCAHERLRDFFYCKSHFRASVVCFLNWLLAYVYVFTVIYVV